MFVSPTPWPATVAAKQVAGGRSVRPIEQTTNTARRMMSRRGTPAPPTLGARQGFAGAKPLRSAARCARLRRAVVGARHSAASRPTPVAGRMDSCSRCDNANGLMKPHPCVCTASPGVEAGIGRGWSRAGSGFRPLGHAALTQGRIRAAGGNGDSGRAGRNKNNSMREGRFAKKWRWIQKGVVTTHCSLQGGGGTGASNGSETLGGSRRAGHKQGPCAEQRAGGLRERRQRD